MKRMRRTRSILASLALALACWVLVEGALIIRDARKDLFELSYLVNDNLLYLRGTMTEVQETASDLRQASSEWTAASKEQRVYWQETGARVNRVLGEAEHLVAHSRGLVQKLDANVNDALLPEATADLRELGEVLRSVRGTAEVLEALASAPENLAIQEEALAVLRQAELTVAQGERTLAAVERTMAETEKVPPAVRRTLLVQILSTLAITLKTLLTD